jgi:hypothetical protein
MGDYRHEQQILNNQLFVIYRLRLCMTSEAGGLDDFIRWSTADSESTMQSGPGIPVA